VLEQSRTEAAVLASLIDGEVVPRLLMVRGVMPGLRASAIEGVVTSTLAQNSSATQAAPCAIPQDTSIATAAQRVAASARVGEGAEAIVSKVAALSLSADAAPLGEYMDTLRLSGLPLEDVFLGVLGPAAKWLGRQWDEDEISFTDVTLGLGRLQALFDRMRHERGGDPTHAMATNAQARGLSAEMRGTSGRAIMLATVPGEHHTFGLAIAEHMFFEAGWRVEAITGVSQFELMRRIEDAQVDIVALSLSSHALVPSALALIAAIRRTPRLRGVRIMVSGALATHEPNLRAMLGVDTIATDGPGAIVLAETLAAQRQIAD
jgi:methanogenic corrinoid protein MtbC1